MRWTKHQRPCPGLYDANVVTADCSQNDLQFTFSWCWLLKFCRSLRNIRRTLLAKWNTTILGLQLTKRQSVRQWQTMVVRFEKRSPSVRTVYRHYCCRRSSSISIYIIIFACTSMQCFSRIVMLSRFWIIARYRFLANVNVSLFVIVRPSVVCRLSVTFVHPTQAIEIFGNVSTPFGTLATCWHSGKFLRRSSQGNPSVGGVKHKR